MGIVGKWAESLDYQYEINTAICVRHKSPFSTCQACVGVCHENAISLIDSKPEINRDQCSECGKCLAICPVQAISGIYPKRNVLNGELIIDSEHIPSFNELLIYYAKGIKILSYEENEIDSSLLQAFDKANQYLHELNKEPFQLKTGVSCPEEDEPTYSRRDLFSLWKKESKTLVSQVTPAKWRFNQEDFELAKYYRDYQFYSIQINNHQCSLCKICVSLCEKNCFKIVEDQLIVSSQSCSDCKLCTDVCPENAITILQNISEIKQNEYPLFTKTCSSCKKSFQTLRAEDDCCFICNKRKADYLPS
ncbi:4Fe-4S binding protein [Bacillus massiliigorillae]|uniref:4Fe-4S binding protein n=1 Tax=Bacillus massiliigorillae TaxID=1243664 RepID=UPI0003AA057D|nr:4Fe-4S binding protein [Bacillus massiliigorillae]